MPDLVYIYNTDTGQTVLRRIQAADVGSGQIASGLIANNAVVSGSVASGQLGTFHHAGGFLTSALVGSGELGTPLFRAGGILSASVGSGQLGPHVAAAGILSAHITSGGVGTPHVAAAAITSALVASGALGPHVAAAGILSAHIAFGAVTAEHIASGSITENRLVSGISIDISEMVQEPSFRTAEAIQAYQVVYFSLSGAFAPARALQSGTVPGVGLALASGTSGSLTTLQTKGRVVNANWNFSGFVGRLVFVGTSSEVVASSPPQSGAIIQRIGQVVSPVSVIFEPGLETVQLGG